MIAWIVITVVLLIAAIALWIVSDNSCSDAPVIFASLLSCVVFVLILTLIICPIINNQSISVFESQSEYLSGHTSKNDLEDAAITTKKIELNDWLYKAQWSKNTFGILSLYPDKINELEPIQ